MSKIIMINRNCFLSVAVAVLFFSGCSGEERPADMPLLVPFEITLTAEGAPVENAGVTLHSTTPDFKWVVGGFTDARGRATIATQGRYLGVPEGEYAVTVEKTESEQYDPENPPPTVRFYTYTKPEYNDPEQTPLKVNVTRRNRSETLDVGKLEKSVLRVTPTN